MKDWRAVGDLLFAEVRHQWLTYAAAVLNGGDVDLSVPGLRLHRQVKGEGGKTSPGFIKAVYAWENGNPNDLVEYLWSDRPINKRDRERLIMGVRRISGRPNHRQEQPLPKFAASLAVALYKEWCLRNQKAQVSSRGYARHMQDACADFIAGILASVDAEHVRGLMNEKKQRRTAPEVFAIKPVPLIERLIAEQDEYLRKHRQK